MRWNPQRHRRLEKGTAAYRAAEEKSLRYAVDVTNRDIERLTGLLFPHLDDRTIKFTASLDGRHRRYSVDETYPTITSRQYKVKRNTRYNSVDAQYWHPNAVWAGYYRQGTPGWKHVEGWHKVQVLQYLLENEDPITDPKTLDEASSIILDLARALRTDSMLDETQEAALNILEDHHRDKAIERPNPLWRNNPDPEQEFCLCSHCYHMVGADGPEEYCDLCKAAGCTYNGWSCKVKEGRYTEDGFE